MSADTEGGLIVATKEYNQKLKRMIADILLQHVGKENSIKAIRIGSLVGIDTTDQRASQVRTLIREIIQDLKIPVGGSPDGYYIISNQGELSARQEYLDNLGAGIENRKQIELEAYLDFTEKKNNGKTQPELF
jgi:alpha-L-arabinofuranosidase